LLGIPILFKPDFSHATAEERLRVSYHSRPRDFMRLFASVSKPKRAQLPTVSNFQIISVTSGERVCLAQRVPDSTIARLTTRHAGEERQSLRTVQSTANKLNMSGSCMSRASKETRDCLSASRSIFSSPFFQERV
jgi:hypothetical protein